MFVFVNFIFVFEKFATVGNDRFFTGKDKKNQIWAKKESLILFNFISRSLLLQRIQLNSMDNEQHSGALSPVLSLSCPNVKTRIFLDTVL